jgi:hypothetical protein
MMKHRGVPGSDLLRFAGVIAPEDAAELRQAIAGECEQGHAGHRRLGGVARQVPPLAVDVRVDDERLVIALSDGRELSVPVEWFPRLRDAQSGQRSAWKLVGGGVGIHWPELDEDISVESLLNP